MNRCAFSLGLFVFLSNVCFGAMPKLAGVGTAMQEMVTKNEVAGAVTVVVSADKLLHLETTGFADIAAQQRMAPVTLFWVASMTKPITGTAIPILHAECKLQVSE